MSDNNRFRFSPALLLPGALAAGAVCTRWIPATWFPYILSCSILVILILGALASLNSKNERRPPVPLAVILETLWLPSRNAEIKTGPVLWMFLSVSSFVAGLLLSALLL